MSTKLLFFVALVVGQEVYQAYTDGTGDATVTPMPVTYPISSDDLNAAAGLTTLVGGALGLIVAIALIFPTPTAMSEMESLPRLLSASLPPTPENP